MAPRPPPKAAQRGRLARSLPNSAGADRAMSAPNPEFMRVATRGVTIHPLSVSYPAIGSSRSSGVASIAGHTRTSLLRTLNSSGRFDKDWLLPETKEMFDNQWARQQRFLQEDERKLQKRPRRKKKTVDPMSVSSKKWLSQNGLNALKLTILDALAPTIIPHEPTYVPILNKHVLSKVFDDILPIAHASGNRKRIRIVNPMGVNLKDYVTKVTKAEERYRKRLDAIVWNALPDSFKEEHAEGPISYTANREAADKTLEEAGWPIPKRDMVALESEIRQAQIYIKQANDLMTTNPTKKEDDARSDSSAGSRSEKKKGTKPRQCVVFHLMKGQRIIGRNEQDGFYYPGSVVRCPDMRHCKAEFDELGYQMVPTRFVITVSGSRSVPYLMTGDYVLARVVNQDTNMECYVPGIVQLPPINMCKKIKYYTIIMYTGQKDSFLRSYLVMISKMRYLFTVRYIRDLEPTEADHQLSDINDDDDVKETMHSKRSGENPGRDRSESRSHSSSRSRSRSRDSSRSGSTSSYRSPSRPNQAKTRSMSTSTKSRSRENSPLTSSLIAAESPHEARPKSVVVIDKERARSDSSLSRSRTPSPARRGSIKGESEAMKQERNRLERWQRNLEEMQCNQKKTQKKLRKQAYKLEALRLRLQDGEGKQNDEQHRLLELILSETKKDDRTQQWVEDQGVEIALDEEKGDILVSSGDKGVLISQTSNPVNIVMAMRHSRSVMKPGEEVLARWSDDGWYYRGTINQQVDNYCYYVEDSVRNLETIYREDILADSDDTDVFIQPKDTVVSLHPSYAFSYAPGVVLETENAGFPKVRFYDGHEACVAREETYLLPPAKFELDVAYIVKHEDQLVGQAVVARNDETGVFQLGAVRRRIGNGRQYLVERSDGQLSPQQAVFIFGAFTKRYPLSVADNVLAIADPDTLIYLPGTITDTNGDKLVVDFCNSFVSHHIEPKQCFWLSQEYFLSAVNFYTQRQAAIAKGDGVDEEDEKNEHQHVDTMPVHEEAPLSADSSSEEFY